MLHSRRSVLTILASLLVAWPACLHLKSAPYPLYPPPARTTDQVAVLSGPVATVDGVEVPSQPSFALLPGCHVVVLQSKVGQGSADGAWSVDLKRTVYAFQMKAGNSYVIEVHLQPGGSASVGNGTVGGVKIAAMERDVSGHAIGRLSPTHDRAEIEACQAGPAPTAP
jgi:hypothetical protein